MNTAKKTALGGIVTALSALSMIISNIIPVGMYVFPALAGILIYVLSLICGKSYGWSAFAAVGIISFILCADKETVLCYLFLLGYYPMIKSYIEKIRLKPVAFVLKLAVLNSAAVGIYFLMLYVFSMSQEEFMIFGVSLPLVFLAMLNIVFIVYDYSLTVFNKTYCRKITEIITKMFK